MQDHITNKNMVSMEYP